MQQSIFIVHCNRIPRKSSYSLDFPYNEQLVSRIKELPIATRKWDSSTHTWTVSTASLYEIIKIYRNSDKIQFDFGNNESRKIFINKIKKIDIAEEEKRKQLEILIQNKEKWIRLKNELEKNYEIHSERLHSYLNDGIKLYPHQIVAALFTNEVRNVLISHEMGLGKTLVSILYCEMNNFEKVFVITPNSLKFNYFGEVEKFTNSKAHIVNWNKNKYSIEEAKYVIVNYDFFNPSDEKRFLNKWKKLNIKTIDALILDECQKIKETKTNIYKNYKKTFNKKIFRNENVSKVFMSGTPNPNRAYELYSVLHEISPIDFATKEYFNEYYCGMKYDLESGWGYVTDTAETKFEELFHKIAPYTHRKRKIDALKDLPEKIYQKIIFELSDKEYKIYDEIESNVVNEFLEKKVSNPLTIMIRLRQYVAQLKIKYLKELVENILETGEKIIIVDMFKNTLYELKEIFGDIAGLHTGDQSVEERAEIVNKFQDPNSEIRIFLGSIQTANYGLTLTAANRMFIISLPYSVGEYDQVSDRCHRIGQKNIVNIYPLIFKETIDEYIFSLIESKRTEIVKVMDNEDYKSNISESVLREVIKKIGEKHGKIL